MRIVDFKPDVKVLDEVLSGVATASQNFSNSEGDLEPPLFTSRLAALDLLFRDSISCSSWSQMMEPSVISFSAFNCNERRNKEASETHSGLKFCKNGRRVSIPFIFNIFPVTVVRVVPYRCERTFIAFHDC